MNPEDFFSYLTSPKLQSKLLPLKILFLLASLFLSGFIIYILKKTNWFRYYFGEDVTEFKNWQAFEVVELVKKWQRIKKRLEKGWEPELKLAIIEADKLLDEALKRMGHAGESLGERLNQIDQKSLPNLEAIRQAHQIRNNIIHDPDYRLSLDRAGQIIAIYEQTFKDLELF